MPKLLVLVLLLLPGVTLGQKEITWDVLADVTFTDKYSEEVEAYFYYPDFGPSVRALEGKEVYLKGYMLVLGAGRDFHILSRNPYAACFFCGASGPESIVELKLKPGHRQFRMDDVVTIKGRLKLNQDDLDQCNYILDDAEIFIKVE